VFKAILIRDLKLEISRFSEIAAKILLFLVTLLSFRLFLPAEYHIDKSLLAGLFTIFFILLAPQSLSIREDIADDSFVQYYLYHFSVPSYLISKMISLYLTSFLPFLAIIALLSFILGYDNIDQLIFALFSLSIGLLSLYLLSSVVSVAAVTTVIYLILFPLMVPMFIFFGSYILHPELYKILIMWGLNIIYFSLSIIFASFVLKF